MDRLACDRMFAAVIESGSFAAAALRLGTSAGQASKLVSRLEAELGVRLITRTTRALAATEAGRAYHARLRDILDDFDALDSEVRQIGGQPRGRIRLTAPLTFGALRLVPVLNDFVCAWPEIALEVQFTDRLVNLVDEGFDMAVRVGAVADTSLVARRLCAARMLLVASPAYLTRRGAPRVPGELTAHDCIIDLNNREPRRWSFAGGTVAVDGRVAYSNAAACLAAAEAGLGIAYSPDFVAGAALSGGRVVPLLADHLPPGFGVHALYPSGRHLAGKLRALVDHLVAGLGA